MRRRSAAPWWFQIAVAVAIAYAARMLGAGMHPPASGGDGNIELHLAFWAFVIKLAGWIWTGFQAAGQASLAAVQWSVVTLWAFARSVHNFALGIGKDLLKGLRRGWEFFETTYEHVLKPAWQTFWKWFDRARRWLEDILRPIFKWLEFVRKWVVDFYAKYVRPILDAFDIARRVLRILETMGLDWARRLDGYLAEIQRRIEEPFRVLLAKINQITNVVNRIATADGLFQRVALIRSIERDIREVSRAFVNWRAAPRTAEDAAALVQRVNARTMADARRDFPIAVLEGGGRHRALIEEMRAQWEMYLRAR